MIHTKYAKQRLNDSLYRPWLGLRDYRNALAQRGIRLLVLRGAPPAVVLALAERAALVVGDVGYTRVGRQWHRQLAAECPCEFHAVETEVVVPVRLASSREEPAAATLRPKLRRHFHRFLRPVQTIALLHASLGDKRFPWSSIRECGGQDREWRGFAVLEIRMNVQGELCDGIAEALAEVDGIDRTVPRVESFRGGSTEAEARLATFLREKLPGFATHRKDPNAHYQSHLAPCEYSVSATYHHLPSPGADRRVFCRPPLRLHLADPRRAGGHGREQPDACQRSSRTTLLALRTAGRVCSC